jgi:hypothetical protein
MNTGPVGFRFKGTVAAKVQQSGQIVEPGEEFDVPVELALTFANNGLFEALDPARIAELRQAEADAQAEQDAARLAHMAEHGLVNAHPSAPQVPAVPAEAARPATSRPRGPRTAETAAAAQPAAE